MANNRFSQKHVKGTFMSTFTTGTTQQGIWNYIENNQINLAVETFRRDPKQLYYTEGHNQDTTLHVIAAKGTPEMLKAVLEVVTEVDPGAIDAPNKNKATPLMSAGAAGRADNADILMDGGANLNAVSLQEDSLISKTIKGRNQDDVRPAEQAAFDRIIERAIEKGAKVRPKDIDMADTFEDNKNMRFLEGKMSEQKAAAATTKPVNNAVKPAPVSKFN